MQKVRLLDKIVANQIAAGEVVDRPASIVKELVENSIDAGADIIEIEIAEGGVRYLRVTDNGSGMSAQDAQLSIERHATSKINTAEDLHKIMTMGFRGEALPSIASVSKFRLITREAEAALATCIEVFGGEIRETSSAPGNVGTSVIVEDVFYNLPARRKFLKSMATESRYIGELITKLALSRPDIKFAFKNNGRISLQTGGNGRIADCIHTLFGRQVSEHLLPLKYEQEQIMIKGYVSTPDFTRNNRSLQLCFINNRCVTGKILYAAIDGAYRSQTAKGTHPFVLLDISLDGTQVDVNVHPQKQEVKFSDENFIYKAVFRAISQALDYPLVEKTAATVVNEAPAPTYGGATSAVQMQSNQSASASDKEREPVDTLSVQTVNKPALLKNDAVLTTLKGEDVGIWRNADPEQGIREYLERSAAPAVAVSQLNTHKMPTKPIPVESTEPKLSERTVLPSAQPVAEPLFIAEPSTEQPQALAQIFHKYVLAALGKELYIIDQHAAHERIIYDRLKAKKTVPMIQELLVPEFITLLRHETELVNEYSAQFAEIGLRIEAVGDNKIRVESVPGQLKQAELREFFEYMLQRLAIPGEVGLEIFHKEVAHSIACKAAIKTGYKLSTADMQELITQLYATQNPYTCPHGRPIINKFSESQLDKMFKRI